MKYMNRIADEIILKKLEVSGAVLVEGAKYCGKTKTSEHIAKSSIYLQDPDHSNQYKKIANVKPSMLLIGNNPRLIDEWQDIPVLWDSVRFEVDRRNEKGLFILTGSSAVPEGITAHSGTGRISRFKMRPMTLYESKNSSGEISLSKLFDGKDDIYGISNLELSDIVSLIARGGWPATINDSEDVAIKSVIDYVESVINNDLKKVDGIVRNPNRVRSLLKSYARNISTLATYKTIKEDMLSGNDDFLSEKSIPEYINVLEKVHIIEDIPAWNPILRSKTAIRTSPKRQFVDPSIAVAIMRQTPKSLLNDFNYLGFLFESMCQRDLRVYAESIDGNLFHYRDRYDNEIDSVIVLNDGRYALVEIKLGDGEIESAAKNLLNIASKIDQEKMNKPSFLMVLTGTKYAYKREDGVIVVPIGCLTP